MKSTALDRIILSYLVYRINSTVTVQWVFGVMFPLKGPNSAIVVVIAIRSFYNNEMLYNWFHTSEVCQKTIVGTVSEYET